MKVVKGVNIEEEAANYLEDVARQAYRSFAAQAAMILEEWVIAKRKEQANEKEKTA